MVSVVCGFYLCWIVFSCRLLVWIFKMSSSPSVECSLQNLSLLAFERPNLNYEVIIKILHENCLNATIFSFIAIIPGIILLSSKVSCHSRPAAVFAAGVSPFLCPFQAVRWKLWTTGSFGQAWMSLEENQLPCLLCPKKWFQFQVTLSCSTYSQLR